ncbi:MAG: T9SS type A sorting domain-containing protein [Ignavibacteria bacterium]|nr:T9SS type A sorting domain-containing protein [Ignavibacteria bacterium]
MPDLQALSALLMTAFDLKTGIVMIANQSIPCDKMAVEILRYLNEGNTSNIIQTSANIPESIKLYQNYPNPFNPGTNINYDLPDNNYVSLKVFDALGKEVATLVNEKQNAGSYSVDFNGEGFPSGVYFCKLSAGEYSEIKRMVLIK